MISSPCILPLSDPTQPLALEKLLQPEQPLEIEVGCGNGRFLIARAQQEPDTLFLGIERLLPRVRKLERKVNRLKIKNLKVLRLEAHYVFHYLLPAHRARAVHVFFPDPWPKRRHHDQRLFTPRFLDALWQCLTIGGSVQIATDHQGYFMVIQQLFSADRRFQARLVRLRTPCEESDFERLFKKQGVLIAECAFSTLAAPETPLPPLTIAEFAEPRQRT